MTVTGMSDGCRLQEISEVGFVGGRVEHFRRTADAKPGEIVEQRLGLQPAAKLGQARDKPAFKVGPVQARPLCCRDSSAER